MKERKSRRGNFLRLYNYLEETLSTGRCKTIQSVLSSRKHAPMGTRSCIPGIIHAPIREARAIIFLRAQANSYARLGGTYSFFLHVKSSDHFSFTP